MKSSSSVTCFSSIELKLDWRTCLLMGFGGPAICNILCHFQPPPPPQECLNQIHVKLVIGPFKSFSVTTSNLSWIFQDSRIIHIYSALNISTVTTIAWFRPRPLLQQPDPPLNHSDSHHNHVSKLIICRSIRYHHNSIFVKCF